MKSNRKLQLIILLFVLFSSSILISFTEYMKSIDLYSGAGTNNSLNSASGGRRLFGNIHIYGFDDEGEFSHEDESKIINIDKTFSYEILKWKEEFRWGRECRVELHLEAQIINYEATIRIQGKAILFEGISEDTEDDEHTRELKPILIPTGGDIVYSKLGLYNDLSDIPIHWDYSLGDLSGFFGFKLYDFAIVEFFLRNLDKGQSPPNVIRCLSGYADVYGFDDEYEQTSERTERTYYINQRLYNYRNFERLKIERKWGKECRVEIHLNAWISNDEKIHITGYVLFFEGVDEDPSDKESAREFEHFTLPIDGDLVYRQLTLYNHESLTPDNFIGGCADFVNVELFLRNLDQHQSPPTGKRKLIGNIHIYGHDDDPWLNPDDNEYTDIRVNKILNKNKFTKWKTRFGWGWECRVEVELSAFVKNNGNILVSGILLFFEGISESTDDLDGSLTMKPLLITPDGPYRSITYKVINSDEGDDYAKVTLNLKNVKYIPPSNDPPSSDPPDIPTIPPGGHIP